MNPGFNAMNPMGLMNNPMGMLSPMLGMHPMMNPAMAGMMMQQQQQQQQMMTQMMSQQFNAMNFAATGGGGGLNPQFQSMMHPAQQQAYHGQPPSPPSRQNQNQNQNQRPSPPQRGSERVAEVFALVASNSWEEVVALVDSDAVDVDLADARGNTLFMAAASRGHKRLSKRLMKRGAGVNKVRSIHWSPYDPVGAVNAIP
jgi:ankyrin repeat protein